MLISEPPRLAGLATCNTTLSTIFVTSGQNPSGIYRSCIFGHSFCQRQGYLNGYLRNAIFSSPSGMAADPDRDVLYVADTGNNAVRTVHLASGIVETLSGGTPSLLMNKTHVDGSMNIAQFLAPTGLAYDRPNSVLYVADSLNGAVRAIDIQGRTVSTLAGCKLRSECPGSSIYIGCWCSSRDGVGLAVKLGYPTGLAFDATPRVLNKSDSIQTWPFVALERWLYVSDSLAHQIRKIRIRAHYKFETSVKFHTNSYSYDTEFNSTEYAKILESAMRKMWEAQLNWELQQAKGLDVARPAAGLGYQVSLTLDAEVTTIAGTGVAGYTDGVGTAAAFNQPTGLALSADNSILYIADLANHRVRKLELTTGRVSTLAGSGGPLNDTGAVGTSAHLDSPSALTLVSEELFVASRAPSWLYSIDVKTGQVKDLSHILSGELQEVRDEDFIASVASPSAGDAIWVAIVSAVLLLLCCACCVKWARSKAGMDLDPVGGTPVVELHSCVLEEGDEADRAEPEALRDRIARLRDRNEQLEKALRAGTVGTLCLKNAEGPSPEEVFLAMAPAAWSLDSPTLRRLGSSPFSWDLDLYSTDGAEMGARPDELLATALTLCQEMGVQNTLGCSSATLQTFLIGVSQGYLPLPFHNFSHGVYVLQGVVVVLQRCNRLRQLLRPLDISALCIAALGHDLGHLGVSNAFLIESDDPLALQYNDRSVLESMHISTLFRVLQKPGCNIFSGLQREDYRAARKIIIEAIMATDLANRPCRRVSERLSPRETSSSSVIEPLGSTLPRPLDVNSADDRHLVACVVLHASDVSGPVRPWPVSSVWAAKVQLEFQAQVANERQLGLKPSMYLLAPKAQLEMGFIDMFAQPAWSSLVLVAGTGVEDRLADLANNRARWASSVTVV